MSRARANKENRPKRPSTLGLLLGGTGGRKDASKGAEAERQRRRRERDRSSEMAAYVGYDAMYKDGIAQVMPGVCYLRHTLNGFVLTDNSLVEDIRQVEKLLTLALHKLCNRDTCPAADYPCDLFLCYLDRKSTRLNSSHSK